MLEFKGKYNSAIVYTDHIESEAITQILSMLDFEDYKDSVIRIMPDVHAGNGCTIGTTMTISGKVTPNLVGVDISCGMLTTKLKEKEIDLSYFDQIVRKFIPSGFNVHDQPVNNETLNFEKRIYELKALENFKGKNLNISRFIQSIGTLGGGNHFIAIEQDEQGNNYIIIHSGSRSLGTFVAKYYQDLAIEQLKQKYYHLELKRVNDFVNQLKQENRHKDIPIELKKIEGQKKTFGQVEKELAYLEGQDLENYLHDVKICQEYATLNRKTMTDILVKKAGLTIEEQFETIHNYIDFNNMILRKGAISAQLGEKVLIPLNMRDGSLIAIGKGNPEWNFSAPHGAGRILSRTNAKKVIDFEAFQKSMEGIYSTSVCEATLDESPFVYKPFDEIIENTKDTVEILSHIKPIYNYKDSTETD